MTSEDATITIPVHFVQHVEEFEKGASVEEVVIFCLAMRYKVTCGHCLGIVYPRKEKKDG